MGRSVGVIVGMGVAGLVWAASGLRTLPSELYPKLRRGEVLQQVWVDPSYAKQDGFALGSVVSKAQGRERELRDLRRSLEIQAQELARKGAPNRLDLVLVEYVPAQLRLSFGSVFPDHQDGSLTVEGVVRNRAGKIIVAFRIVSGSPELPGASSCLDGVVGDIDQELL